MLKLNKLLYASTEENVFINQIEPTSHQRDVLLTAKNDIRDYLRPQISEATVKVLGMERAVTPRFSTQGSWAYQTCVQPAFNPPQEMDWDFGIYLPVTVWEDSGPPHAMAKLYFKMVEALLNDLCKAKGWTLFTGKDTCIRVQINHWAHIDIPLYAAPETQFMQITEKAAMAKAMTQDAAEPMILSFGDSDAARQQWDDMEDIMMATRAGEWKKSDPGVISRWFIDRVLEHTVQLRRVCRYIKAWRDLQWKNGDGPTSVCLMIAVAQTFEWKNGRDDLALEHSARSLAGALKSDVREAAIDEGKEDFNKRLDQTARQNASARAQNLADNIRAARLKASYLSSEAIALLQSQLGTRIPYRPELVDSDGEKTLVRTIAATTVARPVVKATSAG